MTGETFTNDQNSLKEVLSSEGLIIHEVVEISELKKKGLKIDQKVIVDSPKEHIYNAHFTAMEIELEYLASHDASSLKDRLQAYHLSMTYDRGYRTR